MKKLRWNVARRWALVALTGFSPSLVSAQTPAAPQVPPTVAPAVPRPTADAREDVRDRREDKRDKAEDVRDRREDVRDKAEDVRDRRTQGGPADRREDVRDRREDVRDRNENVRDRREDIRDRREDARDRRGFATRVQNLRSPDFGVWFRRAVDRGLTIADVASEGLGSNIGFQSGDRIVSVNGRNVATEADFIRYVFTEDRLDQPATVIVVRDGVERTFTLQPRTLLEGTERSHYTAVERFGIVLDDRHADRLVVWKVMPRTPAYYGGVRKGDVLVSFNGEQISSAKDLEELINQAKPGNIDLKVTRNEQERTLETELPESYVANRGVWSNDHSYEENQERLKAAPSGPSPNLKEPLRDQLDRR